MSVVNIKSDLKNSTRFGTNKEKKLSENIVALEKHTTILESSLKEQEDALLSFIF